MFYLRFYQIFILASAVMAGLTGLYCEMAGFETTVLFYVVSAVLFLNFFIICIGDIANEILPAMIISYVIFGFTLAFEVMWILDSLA